MAISYGRTDIETPIHADLKETLSHAVIVSNLAYSTERIDRREAHGGNYLSCIGT